MRTLLLLIWIGITPLLALEYYGKNLERYDYPYNVAYLPLTLQGEQAKMAYMDLQPKYPNGQTVLLLHGKNFTGAYWRDTAKALSDKGYRVIMPDQIGFGKSSKPKSLQYSFALLAHNTKALLEHLHIDKVTVLGHSMGGMVATRFALMFPNSVEKLILENPIGLEDWQRFAPNPGFDTWYKSELNKNADTIYKYQLESYYDNKWKPKYQPWVDIWASFTLGGKAYEEVAYVQAKLTDMIYTQPVLYQFDQLTMPTLLIIGQRDKTALGKPLVSPEVRKTMGNYPVLGQKTASAIQHATLKELNGIGHMPHIEVFDEFIKIVFAFLKEK